MIEVTRAVTLEEYVDEAFELDDEQDILLQAKEVLASVIKQLGSQGLQHEWTRKPWIILIGPQ